MKYQGKYLRENPEEKQLRTVLISLIGSIFLCMACLAGTTWAWLQTTITTAGSVITVGKLEVAVTLMRGDQADRESIDPSGQYTYKLSEVGTYSITLINSGSIPGFCTVSLTDNLGNTESFSTGTLHPTGEGLEDSATIELTVTPEDIFNDILPVTLEITPYWGEDPAYTIAAVDEELFVPTEETTDETTGETTDGFFVPDQTVPTIPAVPDPTTPATEPTTEVTEPETTTEATEPEATTEATEEATEPETTTEATEEATEPEATTETTEEATEPEATTEATEEATEPVATTEATEPQIQSQSDDQEETEETTEPSESEVAAESTESEQTE